MKMEEIKISQESLPINSLQLWDENARFPDSYFNASERDLIGHFLSDKNFKILPFMKEVIKDFDLPILEKLVVWRDGDINIVLEGNRRVTCYKLLSRPQLASSFSDKLYKSILELSQEISINDSFKIPCVVSTDKNTCFRYIDRKHANNNNEVPWLEPERVNYSNRRKGTAKDTELLKIAITNYVREMDIPSEIKNLVLGKGYVSTFFRLLASTAAREIYGLSIDKEGGLSFKDPSFPQKLKVVIYEVVKKESFSGQKVDSRELSKKEDIKKYLSSVKKENAEKVDKEISNNLNTDIFGGQSFNQSKSTRSGNKIKVLPKSTSRKHLIPNNCRIRIGITKINNIYRELKDDLLIDDSNSSVPNAVGVLFRVFLEVCLDYYAKINGHTFKQSDGINVKVPWVVKSLCSKGYDQRTFNNINKVGSAKKENSYLSIDNFHEYVHSTTTQPSSSELKLKWDNLQPFFELLWDDINSQPK